MRAPVPPALRRAVGGAAALVLAAPLVGAETPWTPLYNGRDLSGWHVESGRPEAWKANGEMISCVAPGGGYLAHDREYGDFELRLEYRISPGGNSGVGLRFPRGGWPSTDGMEIQILDDAHPRYRKLAPEQANGAVYSFLAPKARPARPAGEWNRLFIHCRGPELVVRLNDVEIQRVDLDAQNTPGKGRLPLSKRPRRGLIGLQSHGDAVDFRRIELREL